MRITKEEEIKILEAREKKILHAYGQVLWGLSHIAEENEDFALYETIAMINQGLSDLILEVEQLLTGTYNEIHNR